MFYPPTVEEGHSPQQRRGNYSRAVSLRQVGQTGKYRMLAFAVAVRPPNCTAGIVAVSAGGDASRATIPWHLRVGGLTCIDWGSRGSRGP